MPSNPLILIGGGPRSGKSTFALALARRRGPRRLFIATAEARDDAMRQRISRHRAERGTDFDTIEEPLDLPGVIRAQTRRPDIPVRPDQRGLEKHGQECPCYGPDVVVIDCLTLWLTNLLLQRPDLDEVLSVVDELIAALASRTCPIIMVTNEVGLGIVPESELGRTFRDLAGLAHQRLARAADEVYFSVLGSMLRIKPSLSLVDPAELGA
ncbi:hypothetical protein AYO40_04010 [Planctomycetaceae bacterium SCGC AG-212-D15]|nr:hypothetical protein AYO40_04010 [Planctomycetaceae bacterium SCGC AG-212-D15]